MSSGGRLAVRVTAAVLTGVVAGFLIWSASGIALTVVLNYAGAP